MKDHDEIANNASHMAGAYHVAGRFWGLIVLVTQQEEGISHREHLKDILDRKA